MQIYYSQMADIFPSFKEKNFLDLNDNNNHHIHPTYTKGETWLKYFSLFNLMYT